CLQVDATIPNFLIQEHLTIALGEGYLKEPIVLKNGYVEVPTRPGIGYELDEEWISAHPLGALQDVGRWFHEDDGSMADW
ncbi:MAG: galactonate dehydratase, partial [Chthonomonadaceae bacterium]|nr:galactonate dehydratase [Chthonomonadaceae bacterium]